MSALLAILFFLSGASALVYQLFWLRLLGLVFGVTVHAASTGWTAFMTGLALGSLFAGLAGDRVRRPLAWFGAAEILTGITAVLTPTAIAALQSLTVSIAPSLPSAGVTSVLSDGVCRNARSYGSDGGDLAARGPVERLQPLSRGEPGGSPVERLLALGLLEGALAVTLLLSFTAPGWIPRSVRLFEPLLRPILGSYLACQAVACAVVEKLLSLYRAGPDELRRFVGIGPVLTDDRPLVEYFLSLPRDREVDLSSLTGDVGRYVEGGPSPR